MAPVFTLGGAGVPFADPNGDQGKPALNKRVTFDFGAGEDIRDIALTPRFAFAINDWAFGVVPEPATRALSIMGFGMVGVAVRCRKRRTAAA